MSAPDIPDVATRIRRTLERSARTLIVRWRSTLLYAVALAAGRLREGAAA